MGGVALIFSSDSHPLIFRVKSVDIFLHLPGLKQFDRLQSLHLYYKILVCDKLQIDWFAHSMNYLVDSIQNIDLFNVHKHIYQWYLIKG